MPLSCLWSATVIASREVEIDTMDDKGTSLAASGRPHQHQGPASAAPAPLPEGEGREAEKTDSGNNPRNFRRTMVLIYVIIIRCEVFIRPSAERKSESGGNDERPDRVSRGGGEANVLLTLRREVGTSVGNLGREAARITAVVKPIRLT
jgi:hypothetical protein